MSDNGAVIPVKTTSTVVWELWSDSSLVSHLRGTSRQLHCTPGQQTTASCLQWTHYNSGPQTPAHGPNPARNESPSGPQSPTGKFNIWKIWHIIHCLAGDWLPIILAINFALAISWLTIICKQFCVSATSIESDISKLVADMQHYLSHWL